MIEDEVAGMRKVEVEQSQLKTRDQDSHARARLHNRSGGFNT